MIYVKQETEDAFTALHVKPPTAQGLIGAIESKYKISGNSIRFLFKQNREGNKVKIDDDMITYYSNEAAFLMQVCNPNPFWGHYDFLDLRLFKVFRISLKLFRYPQNSLEFFRLLRS